MSRGRNTILHAEIELPAEAEGAAEVVDQNWLAVWGDVQYCLLISRTQIHKNALSGGVIIH